MLFLYVCVCISFSLDSIGQISHMDEVLQPCPNTNAVDYIDTFAASLVEMNSAVLCMELNVSCCSSPNNQRTNLRNNSVFHCFELHWQALSFWCWVVLKLLDSHVLLSCKLWQQKNSLWTFGENRIRNFL